MSKLTLNGTISKLRFTGVFVALAVVGAVVGFGISLLNSEVSAVITIKVGKLELGAGLQPAQDVYTMSLSLDSPLGVSQIVKAADTNDTLKEALRSIRFGGSGGVTVRQLQVPSHFQVRVRAQNPTVAVTVAQAAANLLVEEQQAKITDWQNHLKVSWDMAQEEYFLNRNLYSKFANALVSDNETKITPSFQRSLAAMFGMLDTQRRELAMAREKYLLSKVQKSEIIRPAEIEFSILASPARMAALGILMSLIIGFLVLSLGMLPRLRAG